MWASLCTSRHFGGLFCGLAFGLFDLFGPLDEGGEQAQSGGTWGRNILAAMYIM